MTVSEKLGGKKKQNKINVRKQKNMQTKHDYGENAETWEVGTQNQIFLHQCCFASRFKVVN